MSLLSTSGLTRRFGGLVAVNAVDFDLPQGEVRALIGPNGAGKSTFVGLVSGRVAASGGRVRFDGADVTHLPAHRRIGLGIAYTFQITSVFARLSIFENVALAARPRLGRDRAAVADAVGAALERVGLVEPETTPAGALSYGHQRLLEIAMGLAQAPRLMILDEPTQGLAENEIAGFKALIRALKGQVTILLIEHNMSVVMETADRITVLNFGAVLAEGRPDEIRASKAVQSAYLGRV
ncbi:ABC transporter ATP-binding protein [Pikeienuella piscinae]|uniref:ABC transporter ATP-binding protein n=1 Tax=Pikeienuella piscinae TaxID=2748098 RepID=A0A7L5C0U9_9RHOB|nr:ABC transporter ATP-binding protein [Pikeienuella piscinae]QIE56146.1 ABC transporter ATP-binding protein [Pikeienuella piscinae]